MKSSIIASLAILLTLSAFTQDNTQAFNSPRLGYVFQPIGPDVFRGPANIQPIFLNGGTGTSREWTSGPNTVGTLKGAVVVDNNQIGHVFNIPDVGNPFYDQFVVDNAACALPIAYGPIAANLSANLTNIGEPSTLVLKFTPPPGFVGNKVETVTYTSNGNAYSTLTITFTVPNVAPTVAASVSPQRTESGQPIVFSANASDADGHLLTYSWDFGDGSPADNTAAPIHSYSTAGSYTATVSVSDGFVTVVSTVKIDIAGSNRIPSARFTTSDIVAFESVPIVFDAAFSTDPQNSPLTYTWNFGDGSPLGSGSPVAKIYNVAGSYAVTLTATNTEGLKSSVTRSIEVLPENLLGAFNAGVEYSVTFDRGKANKDSLSLKAIVNIGNSAVSEGTECLITIAGETFSVTLDRKLRATSIENGKQSWKVKFGIRKQAFGEVDLLFTIKNANLGLGFNKLGAVSNDDDVVEISAPIVLAIGSKAFEIPTNATFKFNRTGLRARGEGQSD